MTRSPHLCRSRDLIPSFHVTFPRSHSRLFLLLPPLCLEGTPE